MPNTAVKLLCSLLQFNPEFRMTAERALDSDFLRITVRRTIRAIAPAGKQWCLPLTKHEKAALKGGVMERSPDPPQDEATARQIVGELLPGSVKSHRPEVLDHVVWPSNF